MTHRIHSRFITICDDLDDWNIKRKLKRHIERIENVYWFDGNLAVYICEITPSHELWLMEVRAIYKENTPDDVRDKIDNLIQGAIDWQNDSIVYHHVSGINDMVRSFRKMKKYLSFEQENGQRFKPSNFQVADYANVSYLKHTNASLRMPVEDYLNCLRNQHNQSNLI